MDTNEERLQGREALARVQRELEAATWLDALPDFEIPVPEAREPAIEEQAWLGFEAPAWAVGP